MTTPTERSLYGKIGAHKSWARTENRSARTLPARKANRLRFEKLADPNNELTLAERQERAEHLRKAHYANMALKSAQVRRRRKGAA
jgi:hypothetical protein